VIREEVRNWSYMKFPFIKDLGPEKGWYRVGPLARINTCDFIDTPIAEKERQEFMTLGKGKFRGEGMGIVEAPRGTLFHHYKVDEHDQVTMANLIVSTTNNNEPMNRAVQKVAAQLFNGREITEGLLNRIEVAIRAYDPCLSCATHAIGRMPLAVTVLDANGKAAGNKAPMFMLSSIGEQLGRTLDPSQLGLTGVFQKPIDFKALLATLKAQLKK
jgi:NAD-reducing hydrogenase large subunit